MWLGRIPFYHHRCMAVLKSDNELLILSHSFGVAVHEFSLAQRLECWSVVHEKSKVSKYVVGEDLINTQCGWFNKQSWYVCAIPFSSVHII